MSLTKTFKSAIAYINLASAADRVDCYVYVIDVMRVSLAD